MDVAAPYAHWIDDHEVEVTPVPTAGHAPYPPLARGDFETAACLAQLRADTQQRLGALLGGQYWRADQTTERADQVGDSQQRHHDAHLASILLAELRQVERALRQLVNGEYGLCEDCGEPIPTRRLERLPATTRCVGCQARSEARGDERPSRRE